MDNIIHNEALRKILLLDTLEGERNIYHELFADHSDYNYLLVGPSKSGKSSLLFECAFQAAENNINVLFVTRRKIEELPKFFDNREQPSMRILKMIEIVYPSTTEEYLKLMATVHLRTEKYGLVLIDNMEEFYMSAAKNELKMAAKLCAYTYDAVTYLRKIGHSTFLLCSVTTNIHNALHDSCTEALQKWLGNVLFIYPHHSGDGFVIKSESRIIRHDNNDDVSVQGIRAIFKDNKICLQ